MNKQDIAEKVHGVLGTTKADAERAVETMIDCMYVMYDDIYRNVQKIKPAGQRQSA